MADRLLQLDHHVTNVALGRPRRCPRQIAAHRPLPLARACPGAIASTPRASPSWVCRAEEEGKAGAIATATTDVAPADAGASSDNDHAGAAGTSNGNGATAAAAAGAGRLAGIPASALEGEELPYAPLSGGERFWTSVRLAFALPWRRFKKGSVLTFKLDGDISDQARGPFDGGLSMPALCGALRKAALDPRVQGVAIELGPLECGWAKVQEIKRHIDHFRASGKYIIAYMRQASEKEFYLASACSERYAPPSASISLRGFVTGGTFLRGVLDKIGVEPQVRRIGVYKSAGDQLLRRTMAAEQRQQLGEILEDIVDDWVGQVAGALGKSREEVVSFVEDGVYDMDTFKARGWVTDLWYEDQLIEELKMRTLDLRPKEGESDKEREKREKELAKPLRRVGLRKYASVSPTAFGLNKGKKRVVVLRTSGAILGKATGGGSGTITPDDLIPKLRALQRDKGVAAVVLRVDSPGGDALASDLMWREIKQLDAKKPVIASMADVAASGGYYLSMACRAIVAEPLTVTGSIGVVTGKFNLAELYGKIGYSKELLSWGRYAQLLADNRSFSREEEALFDAGAQHAYESFRNKAAASRGMPVEEMQEVAQGRMWTGRKAQQVKLVDALGGVHRAVAMAKAAAGMAADERVAVTEMGRAKRSPLQLLTGGASAGVLLGAALAVAQGRSPAQALALMAGVGAASALPGAAAAGDASAVAGLAAGPLAAAAAQVAMIAQVLQPGGSAYLMTDLDVGTLGTSAAAGPVAGTGALGSGAGAGGDFDSFLAEGGAFDEGWLGWL